MGKATVGTILCGQYVRDVFQEREGGREGWFVSPVPHVWEIYNAPVTLSGDRKTSLPRHRYSTNRLLMHGVRYTDIEN